MPPQNQNLKNVGSLQGGNLQQNYQNKQSLYNSLPEVGGPAGYPIEGLNEFTMNRFVPSLSSKGESGLQDYYRDLEARQSRGEMAPSFKDKEGREHSVVPETSYDRMKEAFRKGEGLSSGPAPSFYDKEGGEFSYVQEEPRRKLQISGPRNPGKWKVPGTKNGGI